MLYITDEAITLIISKEIASSLSYPQTTRLTLMLFSIKIVLALAMVGLINGQSTDEPDHSFSIEVR